MTTIARGTSVLLLVMCAWGAVQKTRSNSAPDVSLSPDRQASYQKADPAQIKQDAEDLAKLSSTLPGDVERANKGVVSKDLKDKLKRIEKLSKKLRGELRLN